MATASGEGGYGCVCGNAYATAKGLRQHQRLKGCSPETERLHLCTYCRRSFETNPGLRQHIRRGHPEEYNRELEAETACSGGDRRWTAMEDRIMAEGEARALAEDPNARLRINDILEPLLVGRTAQSIKGRRRRPAYKHLLESILSGSRRDEAPALVSIEEETVLPIPRADTIPVAPPLPPAGFWEGARPAGSAAAPRVSPPGPPDGAGSRTVPAVTLAMMGRGARSTEWTHRLRNALSTGEEPLQVVEEWLVAKLPYKNAGPPRPRNNRPVRMPARASERRAFLYRETQREFARRRRDVAHAIMDDKPLRAETECPAVDIIQEEYDQLFGAVSPTDTEYISDKSSTTLDCGALIEPSEVSGALRAMKDSAAGLDRTTLADLRATSLQDLTLALNIIFRFAAIPKRFREHRTVLIPKGEKELNNINNWRPITITSTISRLLHKILARRITSKVTLNPEQRGFLPIDGCLASTLILQALIKTCRARVLPHTVLALDLRKAFDSVSHGSIRRALNRFGIDVGTTNYIMASYAGNTTTVSAGEQSTTPIEIRRGVLQGDPLSPVLFNMVSDELFGRLRRTGAGVVVPSMGRVTALAYADDLILVAGSTREAQHLLNITAAFFGKRGLSLNPAKCVALTSLVVPRKKKLYTATTTRLALGGELIKQLGPSEVFGYLGVRIGREGLQPPSPQEVRARCTRVLRAPLKPHQKLTIIKGYLMPRLLSEFLHLGVGLGVLATVDRAVRSVVKSALHLPSQTPNAFLHAPLREGGLGIMSLRASVPRIMVARARALALGGGDLVEAACTSSWTLGRLASFERAIGAEGDTIGAQRRFWSRRLDASYSGNGLQQGAANSFSSS